MKKGDRGASLTIPDRFPGQGGKIKLFLHSTQGMEKLGDEKLHTCPFLLTLIIPEVGSCGAVTKIVSALIRFM